MVMAMKHSLPPSKNLRILIEKTLLSVVLAQRGFTGGSGPTGSFKQNRLRRMFENEINWLDKYFGERSLSTEEYKKHDFRNDRNLVLNRISKVLPLRKTVMHFSLLKKPFVLLILIKLKNNSSLG